MLRYKLRTLLILLAILPPLLGIGWTKYQAWKAERERQRLIKADQEQLRRLLELTTWSIPPPVALKGLRPEAKD